MADPVEQSNPSQSPASSLLANPDEDPNQEMPPLQRELNLSIPEYVRSILHGYRCKEDECLFQNCNRMRRLAVHPTRCTREAANCTVCKQLVTICCHHSRHCIAERCVIPFCNKLKIKMSERELVELDRLSCQGLPPPERLLRPTSSGVISSPGITLEQALKALAHVGKCSVVSCDYLKCIRMKQVIIHIKICNLDIDKCKLCKQFTTLVCFHANRCFKLKCPVSFCTTIKNKMNEQHKKHLQRTHILKRGYLLSSRQLNQFNAFRIRRRGVVCENNFLIR